MNYAVYCLFKTAYSSDPFKVLIYDYCINNFKTNKYKKNP